MRFLAIGVAGLCWLAPAQARAQSGDQSGDQSGEALRARGEQLAKDGRYTEAIDAFKAADRVEPRARHACLIALAYTRRELWPQAEIFLERCERRSTPTDPIPAWVPTAKQQLAERLAAVEVAAVEIRVEPADTDVKLAVSSFAPDELFEPRTIHLPLGRHVIIATAEGYTRTQEMVEVTDKTPRQVVIRLQRPLAPPVGGPAMPASPAPTPSSPSKVPLVVMSAGGALVLGGAAMHLFGYKPALDALRDASTMRDPDLYDRREPRFDRARALTIGLYAAGAVTIATGVILRQTVFARDESPVQVAVSPHDGGGMITVGWTR